MERICRALHHRKRLSVDPPSHLRTMRASKHTVLVLAKERQVQEDSERLGVGGEYNKLRHSTVESLRTFVGSFLELPIVYGTEVSEDHHPVDQEAPGGVRLACWMRSNSSWAREASARGHARDCWSFSAIRRRTIGASRGLDRIYGRGSLRLLASTGC